MKDQYAGDFGDYVKLALLRRLREDRRLAVAWYRTPDDPDRRDGLHVEYLRPEQERRWQHLDPELYQALGAMVSSKCRTISELQRILARPGDRFFDRLLESRGARAPWFAAMAGEVVGDALIFLDPDNGVSSPGFAGSIASVTPEEIAYLRANAQPIIVYHHGTRAKGGQIKELCDIAERLTATCGNVPMCALRAAGWSARSFLIVGPDQQLWQRAEQFARDWTPAVTFHSLIPLAEIGVETNVACDPYSAEAERRVERFADRLDTGVLDDDFGIGLGSGQEPTASS